jgi:hypothetical protein
VKKFITAFTLVSSLFAFSPKQKEIAKIIHQEWSGVEIHGKVYPSWGVAIGLTESSLGANLIGDMESQVVDASLGIMQNRVPTVRFMARKFKELAWLNKLSDKQLVNQMLTNHRLNAKVNAYFFKWNFETYGSHRAAVSCQNGGKNNVPYINRVKRNLKIVRPLIKEIKGE